MFHTFVRLARIHFPIILFGEVSNGKRRLLIFTQMARMLGSSSELPWSQVYNMHANVNAAR